MSVITIPRVLREKLGEEAAEALVEVFNKVEPDLAKIKAELGKELLTKADLSIEIAKVNEHLSIEIAKVNERITEETGKLRVEITKVNERITEETGKLRVEIANVNERITEESGKLRVEIANVKADIIKWMFLFWIGQTAVTVALFKFFVK